MLTHSLLPHLCVVILILQMGKWDSKSRGKWDGRIGTWIWSGWSQCPYACSMPLIHAVLNFELTFERWTKISRAKKEREGDRFEAPDHKHAGVRCKWEMGKGPCDWIVNYRRVVMGEVRFEREVNARGWRIPSLPSWERLGNLLHLSEP